MHDNESLQPAICGIRGEKGLSTTLLVLHIERLRMTKLWKRSQQENALMFHHCFMVEWAMDRRTYIAAYTYSLSAFYAPLFSLC